jgi:hypothetical protein
MRLLKNHTRPNNDMHRSRRSAVRMVTCGTVRRPGDVCSLGASPAVAEVRRGSHHELGWLRNSTLRRPPKATASAAPTIYWQLPWPGWAPSRNVSRPSSAWAPSTPLSCQGGHLSPASKRCGAGHEPELVGGRGKSGADRVGRQRRRERRKPRPESEAMAAKSRACLGGGQGRG